MGSVYAQGVDISDPRYGFNRVPTIGSLVNVLIPAVMIAAGIAFLAALLQGAYQYLSSEGNAEKVKKAQAQFTFSALGLLLMVCAYMITRIIAFVLKVQLPL